MRSARLVACLLALAVALGACTESAPTARNTGTPSPSPTASTPPPRTPGPAIAPLTGLRTTTAILRRPALAIKIDNHVDARPQAALDRADLVYEEPVEGGITRFIAVFHSHDAPNVGPVRSARLTDLDVLKEYGRPILAFSGAASYVLRAIRRAPLVSLPHGAHPSLFRRDSSRWVAPHNLFTTTAGLWRRARTRNTTPARPLFTFGDLLPAKYARARRGWIPFGGGYTADWRFDRRLQRYMRWTGGVKHRLTSGRQVSATNVLIMRVALTRANRVAARRGSPQLLLTGSGPAILMRNGVQIVGKWKRASLRSPTVFLDQLGRPMMFAPGNTWIELVPTRIKPRVR